MQQLLIGVTQPNSPSKSFENVSLVLCSTDLESLGLGSNSQNSSIIYNLTHKGFKSAQCSLLSLGFSFALSIMLLKVIHSFLNHPTSQHHSGLTLKQLSLDPLVWDSGNKSKWDFSYNSKLLAVNTYHSRFLHMWSLWDHKRNKVEIEKQHVLLQYMTIFWLTWKKYVTALKYPINRIVN